MDPRRAQAGLQAGAHRGGDGNPPRVLAFRIPSCYGKGRARYAEKYLERWPRGRRRRFAKPLYGPKAVSRVRIPPSPQVSPDLLVGHDGAHLRALVLDQLARDVDDNLRQLAGERERPLVVRRHGRALVATARQAVRNADL